MHTEQEPELRISDNDTDFKRMIASVVGALMAALIMLGLVGVTPAAANFETVKVFAGNNAAPEEPTPGHPVWPEEVQLGGLSGMTVNRSGAGGVAPGTLYTVGFSNGVGWHVARYSPAGEFELAWSGGTRCGPKAEAPTEESCPSFDTGSGNGDVDIDQATGNVYVLDLQAQNGTVLEYNPGGTKRLAQFAPRAPSGSTATQTPDEVHGADGGFAVDDTGRVYLFDEDNPTDFY